MQVYFHTESIGYLHIGNPNNEGHRSADMSVAEIKGRRKSDHYSLGRFLLSEVSLISMGGDQCQNVELFLGR